MRQHARYALLTQKLLYLYALLPQLWRIRLIEYGIKLPVTNRLAAALRACKQLRQHGRRKGRIRRKSCGGGRVSFPFSAGVPITT